MLNEPLKPTSETSYFRIFLIAVIVGPFFLIALLALANYALPASDAEAFKKPLLAVWAWITSASVLATLLGALKRTDAKIAIQSQATQKSQNETKNEVKDGV